MTILEFRFRHARPSVGAARQDEHHALVCDDLVAIAFRLRVLDDEDAVFVVVAIQGNGKAHAFLPSRTRSPACASNSVIAPACIACSLDALPCLARLATPCAIAARRK